MTENKRRYKTIIAGRTYTIIAKKTEDHLRTVSELANEKINQLQAAMPKLDIEQRSILVAVNALSENLSKQAEVDALKAKVAELENKNEQQRRRIQSLSKNANTSQEKPS